ncbi:hypothetical protein BZM27_52370 [Paraburkholderia steynii]|uniref:Uncharacterized protein n=1 Tax=Paraburkholderia steynii TaxID=1245441 RepID=A0A4R0X8C0_9BURK|nr:hypothetical protein BZM27_52370 [Paraburkholderia steynii]
MFIEQFAPDRITGYFMTNSASLRLSAKKRHTQLNTRGYVTGGLTRSANALPGMTANPDHLRLRCWDSVRRDGKNRCSGQRLHMAFRQARGGTARRWMMRQQKT